MFKQFVRPSAGRLFHTATSRTSSHSRRLVLAGSVAAASYATWHLTSDSQRIRLDSQGAASASQNAPSKLNPITHDAPASSEPPQHNSPPSSHSPSEPSVSSESAPEHAEEEQQGGGGAFNPVTGEINWDCPCLGGMAYGPCGPEFREAFSCFVYSEQEPKGIECVEKFKAMQDCFRAHPDVYKDEIMDDDDDEPSSGDSSENASVPVPIAEPTNKQDKQ